MTGSDDSTTGVAAAYFGAWKSKDINRVRPLLHDHVTFDGALGSTRGIEDTLAGLGRMFAITEHVEVVRRLVDGPDVLTWDEAPTCRDSTPAASPDAGPASASLRVVGSRP
jgi:hypothetical protein